MPSINALYGSGYVPDLGTDSEYNPTTGDVIARMNALYAGPGGVLRSARDAIPESPNMLSALNMVRSGLGTAANWLQGTPEIGPDTLAPLGLAPMGMALTPKNAMLAAKGAREVEPQFLPDIPLGDTRGRRPGPGTTAIEEIGEFDRHPKGPVLAYHGTQENFSNFDLGKSRDLALHFGTPEQADFFSRFPLGNTKPYEQGRVYPVELDMKKPLTLREDPGGHNVDGYIDLIKAEHPRIGRKLDHLYGGDYDELRKALTDLGFDGIRYRNLDEGEGWSYAAFKPGTVKSATTGATLFSDQSRASVPGTVINSLDMSEASRLQRAREMGFNPDETWYHGTQQKFDSFKPSEDGTLGPGVYLTTDEKHAQHFTGNKRGSRGEVLPTHIRGRIATWEDVPPEVMKVPFFKEMFGGTSPAYEAAKWAQENGYSGFRLPMGEAVVFDPKNIRRTDAAFDPSQSHSANLLASDTTRSSIPGTALHNKPRFGVSSCASSDPAQELAFSPEADTDRFRKSIRYGIYCLHPGPALGRPCPSHRSCGQRQRQRGSLRAVCCTCSTDPGV